jgi:hypothetical protein
MTTEIAIMNKLAVALAADSAVTVSTTGPQGNTNKIFNSANKLFALSKHAPVGLMIYGNAGMMGIPWETIVKMYRKHLKSKEFPTLSGYCQDFFDFLDQFDVSAAIQEHYLISVAVFWCRQLRKQIDEWAQKQIQSAKQVSTEQVNATLSEMIQKQYIDFLKPADQSAHSKAVRSKLRRQYRPAVQRITKDVFGKMPLTKQMESWLLAIVVNAASLGPPNQSGIVIAGFGTRDLYPRCQNYDVAAVFSGKTIRRDGQMQAITHEIGAAIIPFAQSDDVKTFMEGIGPILTQFLHTTFYGMMTNGLPDRLRDEIGGSLSLSDEQRKEVRKIAGDMCKGACDSAFRQLAEQQRANYIEPVVRATEFLNMAELAAMAETLVNLVSFRKQVTLEAETVGGPIDVAVITKGDGLVWIKRKHYFPPELNHHFFSNYHRKVDIHDQEA